MEINPGRPPRKECPGQRHGKRDRLPALCAGRVHELEVGEHRDGQRDDTDKDYAFSGFQREHHEDEHVPAGRKARKGPVLGLHPGVAEIDDRAIGDHNDRRPASPARQQPRLEEREGGDEDIGQIVDDQIEQHTVIGGPVVLDVILARQRTIEPVHEKRDDQPQEHHVPSLLHRLQHGEHGEHSSGGREKMNEQGFETYRHLDHFTDQRLKSNIYPRIAVLQPAARGWARA